MLRWTLVNEVRTNGEHREGDARFFAPLPEALRECLSSEDEIRFCIESDIDLAGRFGRSFLLITKTQVIGIDESRERVALPLAALSSAHSEELFSGGRLMAVTEEGEKQIIMYSRNLVPEFTAAGRLLDDLVHDREVLLPEIEDPAFCPRSGVPLPERGARSPLDLPRWQIFTRVYEFIAPYRRWVILMTGAMIVSVACQMSIPLITKFIVDDVLQGGEISLVADDVLSHLGWLCLLIAMAFFGVSISRVIGNAVTAWLSGRVTADLRARLHEQLQRLRMGYHGKHESGELIGRVMSDTGELQRFLVEGVPYLIINTLSFISIGIILLFLNPVLALFVFLPVPFLLGGGGWFWKRLVPMFHQRGNRQSVLQSTLSESIQGIRSVKALVQEERRHRIFTRDNENLFQVVYRLQRTWIGFFEITALAMGLGTAAVWYFGGESILTPGSEFTFGDLIAFIGYMAMFYAPLQWFVAVVNWMTHAFASAERIFQVLDERPEKYDASDAIDLPEVSGAISFNKVRFSYNRGKEVIKGVSFDIQPGQMVGLVGKSGAGKSTLTQLLYRFHDVDSGSITVDGYDIRKLKLDQWRRHIGIVMQDPFLFSASIMENIRYGKPDADFADVVRVARAAQAHEFILDKEEGYDTVIGDGGVSLSEGERQRIAIARAILSDPPILILDEATSSVDSETERAIQEAIRTLVQGRTTIAIAHRLATLRHADRLIVIGDGEILEEGTHEALLEKEDGHFARLVRIQNENNRYRNEREVYSHED